MIKSLHIEKFRLFENITFELGKRITVIAGHNAVGKSTLLGILGNMVEYKADNIFGKKFRTEFSEIFKSSPDFDKKGEHKGTVYFCSPLNFTKTNNEASFRSTRQENGERFRIIPDRFDENGKKTASKYPLPVIYLGLSRLYPLGETSNTLQKDDLYLTGEEKSWFTSNYKNILSIADNINDISNLKTKEVKSNFTGITTNKYDSLCNSAGQDNLGQIMLSLLSFKRLKNTINDWEGGLFIVDELDATLHPVAQQKLIEFLFKYAKDIDLQIVFTTHSLSILEYIAKKYEGNNTFANDYRLIFISNANVRIKIDQNPPYEQIKNNLCLTISQKQKNKEKLLVYSEDDETRWFFSKLILGYVGKLKLLKLNFGCSQLEKLYKEDTNYFSKVLFIVDGDVKVSNPRFVKKENVMALIGETRPEKLIFDYLNDENCNFWKEPGLEKLGMTKKSFLDDKGPFSSKYDNFKERKKYSSWFFDQKKRIEEYKMS